MIRERSYLTWLAACGIGAGALVGVAGLVGTDVVPSAASLAANATATVPACAGTTWTTARGTRLCLQSAPFAVDGGVQRRLTPFEARHLTPSEVRDLLEKRPLPGISGSRINPPVLPATMAAFRSGSALLQIDRPCQDESATF